MTECIECGEEYSDKRRELGYLTCLNCGEIHAFKEIQRKATCVAPAYNKGAYQYVISKEMAKEIGK